MGREEQRVATGSAMAATDHRHHNIPLARQRPVVVSPSNAVVAATVCDGGMATYRPLLLCDLHSFLVPSLLLSMAFAQLNLLPTKLNKASKNPKDYIIVRAKTT